jgi:hypothetical protein
MNEEKELVAKFTSFLDEICGAKRIDLDQVSKNYILGPPNTFTTIEDFTEDLIDEDHFVAAYQIDDQYFLEKGFHRSELGSYRNMTIILTTVFDEGYRVYFYYSVTSEDETYMGIFIRAITSKVNEIFNAKL